MAATFEWSLPTLDRNLADGGVTVAHWRCTASDGDYSASRYGTCGFTYDASSSDFTPYADLTESQVLGWVWAGDVDKDGTQAALQASIDADKTPTSGTGVPW